MSMFENDQFRWRETYYVLFDGGKRPRLKAIVQKLAALGHHVTIANARGDARGNFESLTILSPDDFAAMDVCFCSGDEVREQMPELVKELRSGDCSREELQKLKRLETLDARIDVLHFEQIGEGPGEDLDEVFDPSSLLIVLDVLVEMTDGIAVDPQSGSLL
jgi:NAD(P)-dependent dehydrogenase (short-subunit alcohol dehydrogenase family)